MSNLTDNYSECLHEGNKWDIVKAAGYAAGKTAQIASRPFRKAGGWAAKKAGGTAKRGIKAGASSMTQSVKDSWSNMMKKRKSQSNIKNFKKNIARNKKIAQQKQ